MKKEDKELLLKDLCGRLPYGVVCQMEDKLIINDSPFYDYILSERHIDLFRNHKDFYIKPYLRSMSSMTEEEKKKYEGLFENVHWVTSGLEDIGILSIDFMECYDNDGGIRNIYDVIPTKAIDWLNAHHFDYRGLIPKGLALPAPDGMYNF